MKALQIENSKLKRSAFVKLQAANEKELCMYTVQVNAAISELESKINARGVNHHNYKYN